MRRRILGAILSVTTIAIVLFAIPLGFVVQRLVDEDAALRVERQAVLAARQIPTDFAGGTDPVELPPAVDGVSLGLYGADGRLVTGRGPDMVEPTVRRALGNEIVDMELADTRLVAVPVAADERVVGLIRAEQSTAASDLRNLELLGFLAGVALAVLAIGAVIGSLLAGRLAQPVRHLRDAAVALGHGNFTVEAPTARIPELDEAGAALVATAATLEDLIGRERAFSADSSHQLRTPVAGLRAAVETELQFPRPDPSLVLEEVLIDIDRLELTITELLSIARTPRHADTVVQVADVVDESVSTWTPRLGQQARRLVAEVPEDLPPVWANRSMLRHVLDVLLDNALRHGRGEVRVSVVAGGPNVTVSITDEGPGFGTPTTGTVAISDPDRTHGLGLPLAIRYVEAMRGKLVLSTPGPLSRVDIVLRRAADPSSYPPLA